MIVKNVKTICFECHSRCGVILEIKSGKITGIKGDKDHPFSRGFICPKGRACMEIVYHPERITKPLVRSGKKGSGSFDAVSWDKALEVISENFLAAKEKFGAESLVIGSGTTRGMAPYLNRFLALFGSPNFMAPSNMSGGPIVIGSSATCGFAMTDPDYENTDCMVLWAHNPEASWPGLYMAAINDGLKKGAKLIVVDPRKTRFAKKADHWLQIRPGTDVYLALTMINIIIEKELYDKEFVEKWTTGFDKLKDYVKSFTIEKCSEITWIKPDSIEKAALTFAKSSSSCIGPGMGGVCQANDAFDLNRSLTIMSAITGNLEVKGGNLNCVPPTKKRSCYGPDYSAYHNLPKEQARKKLGLDRFPLIAHIPIPSPPQTVWPAIEEGNPYPVKALGLFANNSVCAYPNSGRVKNALLSLDFLLCVDYFHTPTTALADVILPPAHWSERDDVEDLLMKNHVFCQPKAVDPVPECRDEKEIVIGIADKMNLEGYWKSVEEALDYRLESINMTYQEFKKIEMFKTPVTYKGYEKYGKFRTVSGKVELYAEYLKTMGIEPMPVFREPDESPVSTPELSKDYPLILTTGGRNIVYYHSSHRNIPSLIKQSPDPLLQIHPETASKYNVAEGDWVYLKSPRGKIEIKISFDESIDKQIVHSPHGYWYGIEDGWKKININMLTDDSKLCPVTGSVPIKALICGIEKK